METTLSAPQGSSNNQNEKNTTFGLRSIAYLGAKLWNENVCIFSDAREIYFSMLKTCTDDPSVLLVDTLWYFHHDILANYVSLMHIVGMLSSEYNDLCFSILARIL